MNTTSTTTTAGPTIAAEPHLRLFIPGPTEVAPEIARVMGTPMIGHRSKDYQALHKSVLPGLAEVLGTKQAIYLVSASATGAMEMAVRNLCAKRCLCLVTGDFAHRWYKLALSNGKAAEAIEYPWDQAVDPGDVEAKLKTGNYDLVTLVHNETSTGVMNPLAEVAAVVRRFEGVLLAVDTVSSMSMVPLELDAHGVDFCFAGTQKGFALAPGLSIVMASARAHQRAKSVEHRGTYFDLLDFEKYAAKNMTPATPPIAHIFALRAQLQRFAAEGLGARYARHAAMKDMARAWAKQRFVPYVPDAIASHSLTTVRNSRGIEIPALNAFLAERRVVIGDGYGQLAGQTFRIAHMGEIQPSDLRKVLDWIDEFLSP